MCYLVGTVLLDTLQRTSGLEGPLEMIAEPVSLEEGAVSQGEAGNRSKSPSRAQVLEPQGPGCPLHLTSSVWRGPLVSS